MIRRPPRSTRVRSSAASDVYKRQLLHSLFNSGVLGTRTVNTKALIFNVKGEDLLFLDRPNLSLKEDQIERYRALGLPASPFRSVGIYAPTRHGSRTGVADVSSLSLIHISEPTRPY